MLHIILIEPRIPQNTGNIGRLCVAANATLHLIHPLGFCLGEKSLKRAGLDYWQYLQKYEWDSVEHFWAHYPLDSRHFFLTTKADKPYYHARFDKECFLYFGREDAGISEEILRANASQCLAIPMTAQARSLNLATSVGIVAYEVLRQQGAWAHLDSGGGVALESSHAGHGL